MYEVKLPHAANADDVARALNVQPAAGLDSGDAEARLAHVGPNALRPAQPVSMWVIFLRQFRSAVIALLVVAAGLSVAFGDMPEALAIVAVIFINTAIGFFTEISAVRSMESLQKLGTATARVRRGRTLVEIDTTALVPGDVVELEAGDIVAADLRLADANKLSCDESALTGESAPVSKETGPLPGDAPLAERRNMAFKGTSVTRGSGAGIVVATGMRTELGAVARLVAEAEDEHTPLEKRLDGLGRNLVWVILLIAALIIALGIVRGKDVWTMVQTGIALSVASIPEGLPIVATIALSRGLLRMARRKALVRRLSSVETLGSASIIFTDKTGTLTENRMTVARFDGEAGGAARDAQGGWSVDGQAGDLLANALKAAVLCNNASVSRGTDSAWATIGDPLEGALVLAAIENGVDPFELRRTWPEVREEPFDSDSKLMATFHAHGGRDAGPLYVAVKGAPEAVLRCCTSLDTPSGVRPITDEDRARWLARNQAIAADGMRMLALATKEVADRNTPPYEGLTFLCLVAMVDPPRADVRASIDSCCDAGIRVIMVTGDQAPTARYVARAVGIVAEADASVVLGRDLRAPAELSGAEAEAMRRANIFARVSPQQKLDLIALHQQTGEIVAMTGDGINDAPALKKADIGVAMGQRGTQVAREVADVVLKDDAFGTIVAAIQEGRVIYGNIRKFVIYLLSCNIAEILVILVASLMNTALPILPLQILFLNVVTDVFPALALGMGEGDPGVMKRRPRPSAEALLPARYWWAIAGYGAYIALGTLGAFLVAQEWMGLAPVEVVTVSFMTLACGQLCHVFNMRNRRASFVWNDVTRNPHVWAALALCAGLLGAAVYVPVLQRVLSTAPLQADAWLAVALFSVLPVALDAIVRGLHGMRRRRT